MRRVLLLTLVGILLLPSCGLVGLYSFGFSPSDHSSGGGELKADSLLIDILAVDETKTIPGVLPKTFTTPNYYLILRIRITNDSDLTQSFYSSNIRIRLDNKEYKHLATESYWYGKAKDIVGVEGLSYGSLIQPGLSLERFLVFEVPYSKEESDYILYIRHSPHEDSIRIIDWDESSGLKHHYQSANKNCKKRVNGIENIPYIVLLCV